jgi:hypothetical protein
MIGLSRFSEADLIDLLEEIDLLGETANKHNPPSQPYPFIELKSAA